MSEKNVIIMRGLPGSGKSTLAKELLEKVHEEGGKGVIHSTDYFFFENGIYRFAPHKLKENHQKNYDAFVESLRQGCGLVICDNTNSRKWEYQKYMDQAKLFGYNVQVVSMEMISAEESFSGTIHNVPMCKIKNMIARWEP